MLNFIYFAALVVIVLMFLYCLKHKHPKTSYISEEEVKKLVEDSMFWDLVVKVVTDKKAVCDEPLNDTGYVVVLQPCKYSECPCFCKFRGLLLNGIVHSRLHKLVLMLYNPDKQFV